MPSRQRTELECCPEVGVERADHGEDVAKIAQGEGRDVEMLELVGACRVQRVDGNGAEKREMARRGDGDRFAAR